MKRCIRIMLTSNGSSINQTVRLIVEEFINVVGGEVHYPDHIIIHIHILICNLDLKLLVVSFSVVESLNRDGRDDSLFKDREGSCILIDQRKDFIVFTLIDDVKSSILV